MAVRRLTATVFTILVWAMIAPAAGAAQPRPAPPIDETGNAVPDSYIVTLVPGAAAGPNAKKLVAGTGGSVGHIFTHALNGFVFKGSAKAAAALLRNPNVRTVVADRTLHLTAETVTPGIKRIRATHPTKPDAQESGFTGAGVRVAVLDTGIDLTHPDLIANIDAGLGRNCIGTGPPQDGHGHGTHVAGIIAASSGNGIGVVGVAPQAHVVPFKVLDDTGTGEWSNLICAIDILTGYATDTDPTNDVWIGNMSLGDTDPVGNCSDGGIRQAICTSVAAGITYTAAAGNSTVDASTFIPAAFPEVITVSAMTDFDGEPGGLSGCLFWIFYCDDTLAEFSNYGSTVDVTAPGTQIYSTWTGGGYQTADGTSMAAPHVAGVAALVKAANPTLSPASIRSILIASGECPNGAWADPAGSGDCVGKGQWAHDPDGYGEPLVNALRAAQAANGWDGAPTVDITSPVDGSAVTGTVNVTATAADDHGVAKVEFFVNGAIASTDVDGSDGWSTSWDSGAVPAGLYAIRATVTDTAGQTQSDEVTVTTDRQGSWVGTYGADGYVLGGWNGTTDLSSLPAGVTLSVEQAARYTWASPTTDVRGLQSPSQSQRRATTWHDNVQVRLRLTFASPYSGTLHLYAVDWDRLARRENVTVNDGSGPRTLNLATAFYPGAWLHFPVTVPAGGSVVITVDHTAGINAVLSGLFLGGASDPTVPSDPTLTSASAGDGTVTLAWTAPASSGGSPITSYTATATPGGATCTTTTLGCTIDSLVNGTTLSFTVRATNSFGAGPASNALSATPATVPGAPTLTSALAGSSQVTLAWAAPSSTGGSPITGYTAMASPGGATCTSTTLGCAIGGLSNGTSYSFTVIATNAMGSSPASNALSATPVQVPNPPQLISATAGNAQVDLAWTAPANDGGSPITGYTATASPGGATCSTATLDCTIGGLTNGIAYSFTVTATSSLGTSAPSNTMTATPATVPNAPTLNTATAGNGKVVMAWAAPTSNGGRPITGYTATASPGGATCSTTSLGCTITGLTNGTTYTVSVTAKNVIGSGPASNALTATPVTVPGAPTLTGAAAGDSQISLTWTAPGSNGGSAITGYTVTATPGGFTCATPTLGCTIGGLTNGTSYTFKATATNAIGTSAPSNSLSQTPGKPPSAPNLTGATAGNAQVALTWTAPASNGGKQITGYRIYRGTSSATKAAVGTTGNVTSYTDTGRVNGTTYFYEVAAINAMGEGAHSNERSATPITSPSAPQNFTATTSATAGVDLAWGVPASNGGSPILAYRIYRGTTSTNRTFLISLTPTTSYTDTTTTPGVRYSYAIAAYNAAGTGLWAPEKFAVAK